MSICFKVFHLDKNKERERFSTEITNYLISNGLNELDTPTISVSDINDIKSFINKYHFNLDPNGYNLDCIQGWKMGEVGIWASNFIAWNNFLDTDNEIVLLMEDDIIFQNEFLNDLNDKVKELPDGWDFFSFFVPRDQHGSYNEKMSVSENISMVYQDWSMLCYLVSRKGAQKLIESCKNLVSLPLDWHVYRQREKFNSYSIKPNVKLMCDIASIDSTFQNKQERKVINGIL